MDDSARASKRRRLASGQGLPSAANSPNTPSKSANGTLKRPTRRSGLRGDARPLDTDEDPLNNDEAVQVTATPTKSISRITLKKSGSGKNSKKDVYDDIDGAFEANTGTRSGRRRARLEEKDDLGSSPTGEPFSKAAVSPAKKNLTSRLRAVSGKRKQREDSTDEDERLIRSQLALAESGDELGTSLNGCSRDEDGMVVDQDEAEIHASRTSRRRKNRADNVDAEDALSINTPNSGARAKFANKRLSKSASKKTNGTDGLGEQDHVAEDLTPNTIRRRKASRKAHENEIAFEQALKPRPKGLKYSADQPLANGSAVIDHLVAKANVADGINGHHSVILDGSEDDLTLLKSIVLSKITQKRPTPLTGLDDEYSKVHQLVEQTVTAGEGNSMLIIGARGSGKSTLVNKVLLEISQKHREDFHVVRLNGFIHTDDKLALREIWRQLGKEMEIGEDSVSKNYADTLTTLLALLSHPSEADGQTSDQVAKAVVFVMDEFDLFATHPRQTLLYNLFDIAQSRKAPIAVLGLTTRIDVVESLEKRVKSRFSHRYVHLSLAKNLDAFKDICKAALTVQHEELQADEATKLASQRSPAKSKPKKGSHPEAGVLATWNASIDNLFDDPGFTKSVVAPHFHRSKLVPALLTSAIVPVMSVHAPDELLTASDFNGRAATLQPPDSKLHLLIALSDLQLALLIAAARLDIILDTDTCNFNMAYAEYISLASKARIQSAAGGAIAAGAGTKVWGKEIARGEWEGLMELELLMPVAGSTGGANAMVRVDVALEEIAPSVPGLDRTMEKWCRTI